MKNAKWISLFFVCILVVFFSGLWIGYRMENNIRPGENSSDIGKESENSKNDKDMSGEYPVQAAEEQDTSNLLTALDVSSQDEAVNADTVYVLVERDMDTGEEVVTKTKLPAKYLGMTREQFVSSMEDYEVSPPLAELERGFVSLEVNRFSASQVEVVMNYSYVKPSSCFYIVMYDGKVTVLLEDKKTVFLDTDINLFDLPGQIQQDILQGMYIPDEESLYDFLEGYTS